MQVFECIFCSVEVIDYTLYVLFLRIIEALAYIWTHLSIWIVELDFEYKIIDSQKYLILHNTRNDNWFSIPITDWYTCTGLFQIEQALNILWPEGKQFVDIYKYVNNVIKIYFVTSCTQSADVIAAGEIFSVLKNSMFLT